MEANMGGESDMIVGWFFIWKTRHQDATLQPPSFKHASLTVKYGDEKDSNEDDGSDPPADGNMDFLPGVPIV
jgi:hypothetical protein